MKFFALLLLLNAWPALAAPTVAPVPDHTIIEVISETVTRTIVHNVTEPSVVVTPKKESIPIVIMMSPTGVPVEAATVSSVDGATVPAPAGPDFVVAPGTAAPGESLVTGYNITEITGNLRMCSCDEASECRKKSTEEMEGCMETCDEHLQEYGKKTDSYLQCFKQNNASVIEAENCLFKDQLKDYCNADANETKFIAQPNWNKLSSIKYDSEPAKELKDNVLWKRDEKKYNKMQQFFHCTKHCMHKKMKQCTANKGCGVRMPKHEELATMMRDCTKNSVKIANSLLTTCQCLAWKNGVKDLQGACVVIGSPYYVDKA